MGNFKNVDILSLVINEMSSFTHSCMHSLAFLAIFAFSGRAPFMIRVTGTKLPVLTSNFADDLLGLFLADEEPSRTLPLFTVTSSRGVCTEQALPRQVLGLEPFRYRAPPKARVQSRPSVMSPLGGTLRDGREERRRGRGPGTGLIGTKTDVPI